MVTHVSSLASVLVTITGQLQCWMCLSKLLWCMVFHHNSMGTMAQKILEWPSLWMLLMEKAMAHIFGDGKVNTLLWVAYLLNILIFRSIHNVHIEWLWVDVTAQVGAKWHEFFTILEIQHGLDVNNMNHIWLLHCLYLSDLNTELASFAEGWNQHQMQLCNGPNCSPANMFGFDMLVHGVRGD